MILTGIVILNWFLNWQLSIFCHIFMLIYCVYILWVLGEWLILIWILKFDYLAVYIWFKLWAWSLERLDKLTKTTDIIIYRLTRHQYLFVVCNLLIITNTSTHFRSILIDINMQSFHRRVLKGFRSLAFIYILLMKLRHYNYDTKR